MPQNTAAAKAVKHLELWKVMAGAAAGLFIAGTTLAFVWISKVDAADLDAVDTRVRALESGESARDVRLSNLEAGQKWALDVQFRMAERLGVLAERPPKPEPVPSPAPHPTPQPSP